MINSLEKTAIVAENCIVFSSSQTFLLRKLLMKMLKKRDTSMPPKVSSSEDEKADAEKVTVMSD